MQTNDGRVITGLVSPQTDGSIVVLGANGQKTTLQERRKWKTVSPSKKSAMPDGLLNHLTLEEIAHLFAFLNQPPNSHLTSRRPNNSSDSAGDSSGFVYTTLLVWRLAACSSHTADRRRGM